MAQRSDTTKPPKPGPWPPAPDSNDAPAIPPSSWAKRTGFRPRFSGETNATDSSPITTPPANPEGPEPAPVHPTPAVNGSTQPTNAQVHGQTVKKRGEAEVRLPPKARVIRQANNGSAEPDAAQAQPSQRVVRNRDRDVESQTVNDEFVSRNVHMKYELRDTPGLVPIGFYGFQHHLSMMGSLILIPLVIVPAMGGDHDDTSMVVSTVLLVSGITTLLQANFGSRLPLVQGPSFVFLAPALAIIKSPEFLGLNGNYDAP